MQKAASDEPAVLPKQPDCEQLRALCVFSICQSRQVADVGKLPGDSGAVVPSSGVGQGLRIECALGYRHTESCIDTVVSSLLKKQ